MANGQTYFMATPALVAFIGNPRFKYKNPSEISRAAGLKSAKTTKKIIGGEWVSEKSAKAIYEICIAEGFKGTFEEAFPRVTNS